MRIAVLYGGRSEEREISLRSGAAVARGLEQKGYEVMLVDARSGLVDSLQMLKPDLAFIALHGRYGEDGTVQGLLEMMNIPFTGPGVLASAACMNKMITKKLLVHDQIPTPDYCLLDGKRVAIDAKAWSDQVINKLGAPLVVKAASQGSSIGTILAHSNDEVLPAIEKALQYDQQLVVEKMIKGRECTVPVMGNQQPQTLPIIEIVSNNEFYDFQAKYNPGIGHHIIPAGFDTETSAKISEVAIAAYQSLGCLGLSRVDIMVDEHNNPWVLEINTIPGMTEVSLFPDAAKAAGISFPDLVDQVVKLALEKN
ncbi:MAG: D-alanine--D-alanine ligase [Methylocystaceae bacterium]